MSSKDKEQKTLNPPMDITDNLFILLFSMSVKYLCYYSAQALPNIHCDGDVVLNIEM